MNNFIIQVEGVRNVGKTFLLNTLNNSIIYKFPFVKYFNELHTYNIENVKQQLNNDPKLFFLTLGYDITILDLASKGLLKQDLIVDRGILSDIVFGIQAQRIDKEFGLIVLNWIIKNYGHIFKVVYIFSDNIIDNRNKDEWKHYNIIETNKIYHYLFDNLNITPIFFKNNFDKISIERFSQCIESK